MQQMKPRLQKTKTRLYIEEEIVIRDGNKIVAKSNENEMANQNENEIYIVAKKRLNGKLLENSSVIENSKTIKTRMLLKILIRVENIIEYFRTKFSTIENSQGKAF